MGINKVAQTIERQGNIELLRILCMFFVMMFHFNLNVILRNDETSQDLNYVALLVNSLVVVAVNTYVLISGFFSIKVKTKSLLNYLVQTEFYAFIAIIVFIVYSSFTNETLVSKSVVVGLHPFHPIGLWFVPCYALLMVVSPLLNWICEDKKTHLITMAVMAGGG